MLPANVVNELLAILVREAGEPRRSESDGQMAEGRSLKEITDAIKTVQSTKSAGSAWGRVRVAYVKFPGADPR